MRGGQIVQCASAYFSNVLGVREVCQIPVIEFLTFQVVTVLARLQISCFHAVFLQKLLVSHSKSLTDSLGYDLSLKWAKKKRFMFVVFCQSHWLLNINSSSSYMHYLLLLN